MTLAAGAPMPQVRAIASLALKNRMAAMTIGPALTGDRAAHASLLAADIKRFLDRPIAPTPRLETPDLPPGAPIGEPALEWLRLSSISCSWK